MEDSQQQYTQAHLELVQRIYDIEDWFRFTTEKTRFQYVLSKSMPPCRGQKASEDGGPASWETLPLLVDGDFFGLWPNPTPEELYITDVIRALCIYWLSFGCWHDPSSSFAVKLRGLYEKLSSYKDTASLYTQLKETQPNAEEPILAAHIDYWIENL